MNVLKDYCYNWRRPFVAIKHLCCNCWQRITRGWCDWDLYCYDDFLTDNLISALDELENKMWHEGGDRVDYHTGEKLSILKLCDELYITREQLKASQDRTVSLDERQALRDKAFKTITYYFDNLWQ